MAKTLFRIAVAVSIVLVMVTAISACAQKPEPEYANSIAEGILLAMNQNDYAEYSKHFDKAMKNAMPEAVFMQTNIDIRDKIGDYISKQFWKAEDKGLYTIVYYKAKFTHEPGDVIVKIVFQEIEGAIYVSGLWFDSPKLRE